MFVLAFITIFLSVVPWAQSSNSRCKKVDQSPVLGTVFFTMNGGRVKNIRGVVVNPAGDVMSDAIVEVFDHPFKLREEGMTDAEVDQITSGKRRAACMTGKDGSFRFAGLPPGTYMLRVGHRSDSQFSAAHVPVILDRVSKRSSSKRLKVELILSI